MSMSITYFYDKKNYFVSSQKEKVCDKSGFVFGLCKSLYCLGSGPLDLLLMHLLTLVFSVEGSEQG